MKKISLFIFLLYFFTGLLLLPHYGQNWDEPVHFARGQAILNYFLTGEKQHFKVLSPKNYYFQKDDTVFYNPVDESKNDQKRITIYKDRQLSFDYFLKDYGHPPLSDILASGFNLVLFEKLGLINDVDSYHVYSLFLAALLVGAVFYWTSKRYNIIAGIIAAISLALYPLFLGESHFNIKDVPEAVFYSLTILFFYEGFTRGKKPLLVISAIFFGCAFATKFNAVFLPFIIIPWLCIYLYSHRTKLRRFLNLIPAILVYPIIGIAILFLSWPFLWSSPIQNFMEVVGYYKGIGINTNFDQRFITFFGFNTYPIKWLIYTTPLVTLFLATLGVLYALIKGKNEKNKTTILILIWLLIPILRVSVPNAGIYGGLRHIMEFIPAMAILSGIGAAWLHDYLAKGIFRHLSYRKFLTLTLLVLMFIPIFIKLISIHPNEGIYFNELVGGLKGAKETQLPDWGMSLGNPYKRGIQWINKNVEKNARVSTNFGLGSDIPAIFIRPDINFHNIYRSFLERKGEYVIGLTHQVGFEDTYFFKYLDTFLEPIYEISVDNVPILKIWKNDIHHTKKSYRDFSLIPIAPRVIKKNEEKAIIIDMRRDFHLAKMLVVFNNETCEKDNEGIMELSQDGETWYRLDGDLRAQLFSPLTTYTQEGDFLYFFAGDKARYIRINYTLENSCFKQLREISIYKLDNL